MNVRKTRVLVVLLVSVAAASASATTINFASLQKNAPDIELAGALMVGTSYTQQGFVIASYGGRFDVWKLGNSNFPGTSPAATSLFDFTAGAETVITRGGQPFTLDSIDFAPLLRGGSGPMILFVYGVISPDQPPVFQMVTINNSPFRLQTVTFPSTFTNVVEVHFLQGTSSGYFTGQETAFQFNNIVVNNRYVNGVNGNDSNDCLSVQTACKTIGHAISLASSGDSIIVAAATYFEGLSIGKNLTILGSGCSKTIINGSSGSGVAHVVTISSAAVVTLSGLSIGGGGSGSTAGGGIYNAGTLTLNNSCVDGNHVQSSGTAGLAAGGGIYNASVLTINNSELSGNTAVASPATGASGGGIYNKGSLTINYSTIKANSASGSGSGGEYGGGISNYGTLTINNTTLVKNSAIGSGGGVYNGGTLTISNATISGNSAIYGGGGIDSPGTAVINNSTISENSAIVGGGIDGPATLQNSIVASNRSGGNCSGTIVSSGYNLSSDSTCNFNKAGDLNSTDPLLGPLQSNGGPTWTMALQPGSPAIDAGNPTGCTDGHGHLLKTDQRGMPRPNTEDIVDKKGCDMGAYEKQSD